MLVRSSIDAGFSSVSDHGKQEFLCVWIPTECDEHKNKNDKLFSQNFLSSSQLSMEVNTSETSNFVYKRRKIQKNAVLPMPRSSTTNFVYKRRKVQTVFPAQVSTNTRESDNNYSGNSSEAISVAPDLASKPGSVDGVSLEEPKVHKFLDLQAINDSCSSSKSNMDLGSSSETNSCFSETNTCFSFLGRHGVLEGSRSNKLTGVDNNNNICCLRSCKVCVQSETTLKMLICDLCEEAFHIYCCNPIVKRVPIGDWFCRSCLTNSGKLVKDDLGSIASMLRDVDTYTSDVRIGKDFQAEVPDWSSPHANKLNDYKEPMEMSPSECASYQDRDSRKLSRLSSIGNWLQCREVVDDVNGTICGKWRRAPLFEVQSNDWECFCSVLWDPTHADCAVPQELDTDQVLKHLKYIDMLRPRLSVKSWKLGVNNGVNREGHTEDPRNTQNL